MSPLKKEDFLWLVAKNKKVRDWKNKGGLNMEMFSTADFDDEGGQAAGSKGGLQGLKAAPSWWLEKKQGPQF